MEDGAVEYQVPRGGPIYHPDLVSPLTRTSEFETSVVIELQNLFSQLQTNNDHQDEDISVNELKILSEEDLVEIASKDALQIDSQIHTSLQTATVEEKNKSKKRKNKGTKRGRQFDRDTRAAELENPSFVGKIEEVAKIKEKQDEERVAVKLHSFSSGGGKGNEVSVPLVENIGKMTSLKFITSSTKIRKLSNVNEHIPIPYPQVILCVEVYKMSKIWVKTQEFLILCSQMLSEWRDQIYCLTDHLMQKAGEHDPSGYFLIEDVFCNDKRDPSAIDYSDPIFEWLRKSKDEACEKWECILSGELQQKQRALLGHATTPHLPQFKAVDMHKIQFCDLSFRVGAGYLYCHQGDCKHIIVIRDMRLIHPEDVQNRAAYPVLTFQHKNRFRKCSVCKVYRATKILDLYKESRDMRSKEGAEPFGSLPRSVVLVGHSMGGFVARAAIVHPRLRKGVVETVLTLSSPHQSPPVALQPSLGHYYHLVNHKSRKGYEVELTHTGRQVSEPTLSHVIVVSISGNILDYQVWSKLETLDGIVPSSHRFMIGTTGMRNAWLSTEHQTILW